MGCLWHLGAVYCLTIFPMSGEPPFLSTWWEQRNTLQKFSRPHHWLHDFLAAGAQASGARPDGISSSSLGWSLEPGLSWSGDTLEGTKDLLRNDWFLVRGRKCTRWICKFCCFFFFSYQDQGSCPGLESAKGLGSQRGSHWPELEQLSIKRNITARDWKHFYFVISHEFKIVSTTKLTVFLRRMLISKWIILKTDK